MTHLSLVNPNPVTRPFDLLLDLPGSKSTANRALIAAVLAEGRTVLEHATPCDDVAAMVDNLQHMGFRLSWLDRDHGRLLVEGGLPATPGTAVLDCGNAGTTLRFLTSLCALVPGDWTLTGSPRMRERPIGPLVHALRRLGAEIEDHDGCPPLRIRGGTLRSGTTVLDASVSSQFASSLLLVAPAVPGGVAVEIQNPASQPYLELTREVMTAFGVTRDGESYRSPGRFAVEGDWSAIGAFLVLAELTGSQVRGRNLDELSRQADRAMPQLIRRAACPRGADRRLPRHARPADEPRRARRPPAGGDALRRRREPAPQGMRSARGAGRGTEQGGGGDQRTRRRCPRAPGDGGEAERSHPRPARRPPHGDGLRRPRLAAARHLDLLAGMRGEELSRLLPRPGAMFVVTLPPAARTTAAVFARRARAAGAGMLEVRGDLTPELARFDSVLPLLVSPRGCAGPWVGGLGPDYLDLELGEDLPAGVPAETRWIRSFHDHEGTPPPAELDAIAARLQADGAELFKLATLVRTEADLRALEGVRDRLPAGRSIVLGMGPLARAHRLCSPSRDAWTYACLDPASASAPGQLSLAEYAAHRTT